jgi:AraC-like DNA-binding protein
MSAQRGILRGHPYLALVFLQAAIYFLKDIVEKHLGLVRLATFLIYIDFLFGLPALFLFLKVRLGEHTSRPVLHFLPSLINIAPAFIMACENIGSPGIDGVVTGWLSYPPWIYINLAAAGECVQLVLYGRASLILVSRNTRGRRYRAMVLITIAGYSCYYGIRWSGLIARILNSSLDELIEAPWWIAPFSVYVLYFFVSLGGIYTLTHFADFFKKGASDESSDTKAKYGGKSISPKETDSIMHKAQSVLNASEDLSDSNIDPHRLAHLVGVPYYLLSRVVNEQCGIDVGALIRDARIKKAKAMLETERDMRIIDIAYASGFSAKSSFNTAFKDVVGESPTAYRQKIAQRKKNS